MEQPKTSIAERVHLCDALKLGYIPSALAALIRQRMDEEAEAAGVKLNWGPERNGADKSDRLYILACIFGEK